MFENEPLLHIRPLTYSANPPTCRSPLSALITRRRRQRCFCFSRVLGRRPRDATTSLSFLQFRINAIITFPPGPGNLYFPPQRCTIEAYKFSCFSFDLATAKFGWRWKRNETTQQSRSINQLGIVYVIKCVADASARLHLLIRPLKKSPGVVTNAHAVMEVAIPDRL